MLKPLIEGEFHTDQLQKTLYATDASVYRQMPQAVAFPKHMDDVKALIQFAKQEHTHLIFRTAGTSLAGQCVGDGIVVDISKYFTKILKLNTQLQQVEVQPGVIRDDLNQFLKPHQLQFGPNTSTSNRCMIGGMVGNNSSGTTSITYGVTRDKIVSLKCLLDDGSRVEFKPLTPKAFHDKLKLPTKEGQIYRQINDILTQPALKKEIINHFPKPSIHRRNTGYALDRLLDSSVFSESQNLINLAHLICGSEGTLAFIESITLQLDPLPPAYAVMVVAHFNSIQDCLEAVQPVMSQNLFTCEMVDKSILDCTKSSLKYKDYRFFLENDPQAILMLELRADNLDELQHQQEDLVHLLRTKTKAYALPILQHQDISKALELRKAGLGLLGSISGDTKAVACIEDTAVSLEDFAPYMADFTNLMNTFNQTPVYYAHAGAGELHLRPNLNLKTNQGVKDFEAITLAVAKLVKSYKGSFSGEHGDGIVRSPFIKLLLGEVCYKAINLVKNSFDPEHIFNPGKIVNPKSITENLRYQPGRVEPEIETLFSFKPEGGLLRAAENCNGSGECRVSKASQQAMCPSYQATLNEKDTTRGRANALREFLTHPEPSKHAFDHPSLKQVFDLCVSCKACKKECPSNVDVASFKSEFLYQYYQTHRRPLADYAVAYIHSIYSIVPPWFYNTLINFTGFNNLTKKIFKIHKNRSLPNLSKQSLKTKIKREFQIKQKQVKAQKTVYLFVDEFTNYLDAKLGQDAIELLNGLGYKLKFITGLESGRALLSKGFLKQSYKIAKTNVSQLSELISAETPLIGLEPSALLSFRDEYLRLNDFDKASTELAQHCYLIEEFIADEYAEGYIKSSQFSSAETHIKIHTHCHQKALSNSKVTFDMLNIPKNYNPRLISAGCCGMAGSFGYEKEHFKVSQDIGELHLMPSLRKIDKQTRVAANGTSCRHQIKDATAIIAEHPVSILKDALLDV